MEKHKKVRKKLVSNNNQTSSVKSKEWNVSIIVILLTTLLQGTHSQPVKQKAPEEEFKQNRQDTKFYPYLSTSEPLFTTTEDPTAASIENKNLSITVETYKNNPYLRTETTVQTPTYREHIHLIDVKMMSIQKNNAKKFLDAHRTQIHYEQQVGFKTEKNIDQQNKTSENQQEFFLHRDHLGFQQCQLVCSILKADMPATQSQLMLAASVLSMEEPMWINTSHSATLRSNWKWKTGMYDYEVTWGNKTIFPPSTSELENNISCQAYRKGQPVDPDKIGFIYSYYNQDHEYDLHKPRRLDTTMSANGLCKIIVAETEHAIDHHWDDQRCVCARNLSQKIIMTHKLESKRINQQLGEMIQQDIIEDWRYKTVSPKTFLGQVNGTVAPRYVSIDQEKLAQMKKKYLIASDLTDITMEEEQPKQLKLKDFQNTLLQGMLKTLITNPSLIKQLHEKAEALARNQPNTELVDTVMLMGASEKLAEEMNKRHPDFYFATQGNKISVVPAKMIKFQWEGLTNNFTDEVAVEGLRYATDTVLNERHFRQEVLPTLIRKIHLPAEQNGDNIDFQRKTIMKIEFHPSFIELKSYVPIYLNKETRMYTLISLPHNFDKKSGKYIAKGVPEKVLENPEAHKVLNLTSKCKLEIYKNDGRLDDCQNVEITYEDINQLLTVNEFSFYLITKVGETSISCPGLTMQWFTFSSEVNIVMIHRSCFLQTSKYNLQIVPSITTYSQGNPILFLLAYDFPTQWMPHLQTRFVVQIITATVVAILLVLMITAIVIVIRKKPWVCKIPQVWLNRDNRRNLALGITHHREVAPSPSHSSIPEDTQHDEECRNYTKDFEDYASGDDTKQTAVECHYATINKKRNKPFKQNLGNQLMAKPAPGVHWKFDGNPLASMVMKKLEAAESKENVKGDN